MPHTPFVWKFRVIGGMVFTVVFLNLLPVLYSFYGRRMPPASAGGMTH